MAENSSDLTTVSDVQAWLSLPSNTDADLLQRLVTAASAFIQQYIGYAVAQGDFTETRDGNGRDSLVLLNRPIASVSSVTINGQTIPESAGWPQPGYSFNENMLMLRDYCFDRGKGNVTITYSSGYADVPYDLAQACIELVALRYKLRDKTGLVSEGMAQQTTSYFQKDMPASVVTALQPYRRVFTP